MIYVVTGQFGSGKTAYVVDQLANDPQYAGRPLFCMGVPELKLEHSPVPPVDQWTELRASEEDPSVLLPYFTFPPNAIIVIDEAQRIFRPRAIGSKVPDEVQAFETHRHTGVDFFLITQHAGLLDSNIRKHKPRHVHIRVTALGSYKYEWPELADPEKASDRETAVRERYKPPKRVFDLYKSSVQHTKIKTRIPWFVYLFGVAVVSTVGLGYYGYQRVTAKIEPPKLQTLQTDQKPSSGGPSSAPQTTAEYLAAEVDRVPGLHHTAPKYDEVTKVTDAPFPSVCLVSSQWVGGKWQEKCGCIDQQGNRYATTFAQCQSFAMNGVFKDWGQKEQKLTERPVDSGKLENSGSKNLVRGGDSLPMPVPDRS